MDGALAAFPDELQRGVPGARAPQGGEAIRGERPAVWATGRVRRLGHQGQNPVL